MPRWRSHFEDLVAGRRRHLLINGSCLEALQAMPPEVIDCCAVDPPYGMDYRGFENQRSAIANDKHPYIWFLGETFRVLKPSAALACFHVERLQDRWKMAIETAGFRCHNQFIWDKGHGGMGDTARALAPCDERAWIASKGRWRLPNGRPDNILRCANIPPGKRHHSTEKPVEVMAYLIKALCRSGGIVIDPTMGSGSTGVAALRHGYRFIGIELDPGNFAVAKKRIDDELRAKARRPKPKLARMSHAYPVHAGVVVDEKKPSRPGANRANIPSAPDLLQLRASVHGPDSSRSPLGQARRSTSRWRVHSRLPSHPPSADGEHGSGDRERSCDHFDHRTVPFGCDREGFLDSTRQLAAGMRKTSAISTEVIQ
ncbi:DNA-methyltransferase [Algisphaera agarilytica]|uniref:Methyltransferase n=1 Tax=Algisphaera agarilytica TaxID=1385975 RepID=A0A7X0H4L2_9BACT|nr:DNA methyltransferase [Algisphaera agarilytica]MBB6429192.1 DNA modification methylase [Algisphaera agarilytica]